MKRPRAAVTRIYTNAQQRSVTYIAQRKSVITKMHERESKHYMLLVTDL